MKLHTRMLVGAALGAGGGALAHFTFHGAPWLDALVRNVTQPAGQVFLRLIFMLILPLIFSALALGVAGLGDLRGLGRIGWRTLVYTVCVSAVAVAIGVTTVNVFEPGRGFSEESRAQLLEGAKERGTGLAAGQAPRMGLDLIVNIVPRNPVEAAGHRLGQISELVAIEQRQAEVLGWTAASQELAGHRQLGGLRLSGQRKQVGLANAAIRGLAAGLKAGGKALGLLVHEVTIHQREGLQRMRGRGPLRTRGHVIGLIEIGQERQPHGALVEQVEAAPIVFGSVQRNGPQVIWFAFGKDEVVDLRLERSLDRPAATLGVERATYLEDAVANELAFQAPPMGAPVQFVAGIDLGFGFIVLNRLLVGAG